MRGADRGHFARDFANKIWPMLYGQKIGKLVKLRIAWNGPIAIAVNRKDLEWTWQNIRAIFRVRSNDGLNLELAGALEL